MKKIIPTYNLEQINGETTSIKEVYYNDEKLLSLGNILSRPYRSNYYGFGLCVAGSAELLCNLDNYLVEANAIITMSPQVIKQWKNVSDDFKVLTIFFTKTYFTKIFSNQNYLEQFHFFHQNTQHINLISNPETQLFFDIFQKIKAYTKQSHRYQNEILASYINILLFEYQSLFEQINFKSQYQLTRNQELVLNFKNLITKHFQEERTVMFYADKMFITPKYLTEILKIETGKTASEWINELLILEAKVLLSNPNLQISQIAEILHFPDASTFGKFFKNLVGTSPLQYRKTL